MSWIKIPDSLLQKCNNDSVTVHLFLHLLTTSDGSGAVTTTLSKLAEELKTTVDKTRSRLAKLESVDLIEIPQSSHKNPIKTPRKGTVVSVCNYESYVVFDLEQSHKNPIKPQQSSHTPKATNKENISPTPPIKENNKEKYSSSTTMRAREEFIQALKGDRIWGESVELRYQLQPGALIPWIERFALDIQCRDVAHKDIQDAKRHFFDWLRIQLRYEQRTTPTSKAGYLQAERERLQREIAELNENYIRQHPGEFPNDL